MKENINLDEKYIINPAYFIRMDHNRAILSHRERIALPVHYEDCFTFLHPFNAQLLTFFDGESSLNEVVNNISHFFSMSSKIVNTVEEFLSSWSGAILLAETTNNSIEPNYHENRRKELAVTIQKYVLLSSIGILIFLSVFRNHLYTNGGLILSLMINLSGIYVSYLLVLKQLHIHSEYADKICSLFKQSDCNNILESKAAKLGGMIGWSEIGMGYFISNVLVILFLPVFVSYYPVDKSTSRILLGNPEAKMLVTVLTNPLCSNSYCHVAGNSSNRLAVYCKGCNRKFNL